MKRILVLSSAEAPETVEANQVFVREIEARLKDTKVETCHYRDIALFIVPGHITATRISTSDSLSGYDLVYFKSFYRYSEQAYAIADFLRQESIKYICHELDHAISFSKLTQYTRLARRNLPIIPTVFVERQSWTQGADIIASQFGFPCVFKAVDAKGGDANYVVNGADELLKVVEQHTGNFVAQQLVPNEYDLRLLVANGEVKRIIKRQRTDESSHLNNTSKGAEASLVPVEEVDESTRRISREAAAEFSREIAGVDIMTNSQTGEVVILEVNASPQVATGAFTDEKLTVYADLFTHLIGD